MKNLLTKIFLITGLSLFSCGATSIIPQTSIISVIANVQITGAVKKPGIYKVPAGTRLVDVLIKAGGLKKDAITTNLNLTSPVIDGSNFYISSKQEMETKPEMKVQQNKVTIVEDKSLKKAKRRERKKASPVGEKIIQSTKLVNLNTAGIEELNSLPGIGEGLAKQIIKYRTKNGRFKDIAAFNNVPGIGDKKIEKLKNKIIF
jgi:competence protein ComEA